jgi:hypothetical protein
MSKIKRFLRFTIIWVACNLSIPFWMVGHVHLSLNIYHDIVEIIASFGMNIIVGVGFWLNWRDEQKNDKRC